jgi:predicted nucleic acid-binding protein
VSDAIELARALASNADALVTHDRDFSRLRSLRVIS